MLANSGHGTLDTDPTGDEILTKLLLPHDFRVIRWVVDDGGGEPEALLVGQRLGPARRDLEAGLLDAPEKPLDAVKVFLVGHGPQERLLVHSGFKTLHELDERGQELVVDRLVDVDALDGRADLARVAEPKEADLARRGHGVDVGAHDGGVVAAQLEREPLQRGAARPGDELADRDRTCDFLSTLARY